MVIDALTFIFNRFYSCANLRGFAGVSALLTCIFGCLRLISLGSVKTFG